MRRPESAGTVVDQIGCASIVRQLILPHATQHAMPSPNEWSHWPRRKQRPDPMRDLDCGYTRRFGHTPNQLCDTETLTPADLHDPTSRAVMPCRRNDRRSDVRLVNRLPKTCRCAWTRKHSQARSEPSKAGDIPVPIGTPDHGGPQDGALPPSARLLQDSLRLKKLPRDFAIRVMRRCALGDRAHGAARDDARPRFLGSETQRRRTCHDRRHAQDSSWPQRTQLTPSTRTRQIDRSHFNAWKRRVH